MKNVFLVLDSGAWHTCSHESVLGVYISREAALKDYPNALPCHPDLIDYDEDERPDYSDVVWIQEEMVKE